MANNTTLPGTNDVIADEDIGGVKFQQMKLIEATVGSTIPTGTDANPLKIRDDNVGWLKALFRFLKPLSVVTGGGSNRLSVDVNNVVGGTLIATQSTAANLKVEAAIAAAQTLATVSTVAAVTTVNQLGGITTFEILKAMSRDAYTSGIRSRLS